MSLGAAVYLLVLVTVVLGFLRLYYAWREVDWAQWWASTRASEEGPPGSRLSSGVRRGSLPESQSDRPSALSPSSSDARSSR